MVRRLAETAQIDDNSAPRGAFFFNFIVLRFSRQDVELKAEC